MDAFYTNIGEKIKTLAKAMMILACVGSVVAGLLILTTDMAILGILVLVGGPVMGWVSSWLIYGFGELIEETGRNRYVNREILTTMKEMLLSTPKSEQTAVGKKPTAKEEKQTTSPKTQQATPVEYVSGKTYFKGARVKFEGQWYVCTTDSDTGCVWSPSQSPSQWEKEEVDDLLGF